MSKSSKPLPEWHAIASGGYKIQIPGSRAVMLSIYLVPEDWLRAGYRKHNKKTTRNPAAAWYWSCDNLGIRNRVVSTNPVSYKEACKLTMFYLKRVLEEKELQVKTWLNHVRKLLDE